MSEFPPHKHEGDQYSPHLCMWTREDGESCQFPLTDYGLELRLKWATDWARMNERERIAQAIDSFLVRFDPKGPAYWPVSEAARIARNGGSDA